MPVDLHAVAEALRRNVSSDPALPKSKWRRSMKVWSLGLGALAWCCIDAPIIGKPLWDTYHYSVHGCSVQYPRSVFRRQPFDVSQQGQRFSGADQSSYFRVLGFQNENQLTSAAIKAKYFAESVP